MIHIRTMTVADVPLGMRLKDQAGWNQTAADWQRILALQPDGSFVAELSGRPVGTTATCVFDAVGWLAMVLVDEAFRGRGIGTRLVEHALRHLDQCGVPCARLDATPLGRPLYEKLGFVAEYELARMGEKGTGPICRHGPKGASHKLDLSPFPGVRPLAAEQIDAVCALDRKVTGTNRRRLIECLYRQQPDAMHIVTSGGEVVGYLSFRRGSRAVQIGPTVALGAEAGRALGDAALRLCAAQPIFVDIPVPNAAAMSWAESRGLRVQRFLTRMRRGAPVVDRPRQLWAAFGPEKG
jgi:predicted N-acetyltransferase YhbS